MDRERFSAEVRERLLALPNVRMEAGEVGELPDGIVVIATGPLTSEALTNALEGYVGEKLYFYDSIAPIVSTDSIDMEIAFRASRWDKGETADYLNLPMDEETYRAFVRELLAGEKVVPHSFEEPRYFEGCLPIEVMAERGEDTLAFGPLKPVGLVDPRTGKRPHAVVQLRMEDVHGSSYNLVGFQTRLTWPEQRRIFKMIPGLANADFLRMGQIHRNTFIDAPRLLQRDLSLRAEPRLFFAGQITGVEGYVESASCGLLTALAIHARLNDTGFVPPPAETSLGALYRHVTGEAHPEGYTYQPSNVIFGLFPPLTGRMKKAEKRAAHGRRAADAIQPWLAQVPPPRRCRGRAGRAPRAGLRSRPPAGWRPASQNPPGVEKTMPNWKRSLGVALLGALLVVTGCKSGESRSASGSSSGVGQPLDPSVQAEDLRLSPDGKHVTYLVNGEKPRVDGIPPQMRLGELRTAPVDGGRVADAGPWRDQRARRLALQPGRALGAAALGLQPGQHVRGAPGGGSLHAGRGAGLARQAGDLHAGQRRWPAGGLRGWRHAEARAPSRGPLPRGGGGGRTGPLHPGRERADLQAPALGGRRTDGRSHRPGIRRR